MNRTRIAVSGGLTLAAGALVAAALLLPGDQPVDTPRSRPAGQVEQVEESSTAPTSTTSVEPEQPSAPVPQDVPAPADTGVMNQPAPPPGVPYDSDGATVVPNPPNMGPGQLAPRPPTQNPPEPAPAPVEPPVLPTLPSDGDGS